jgi:hypothetical protein
LRSAPVSTFRIVIAASVTGASEASVTNPEILAPDCARAQGTHTKSKTSAVNTPTIEILRAFMSMLRVKRFIARELG